MTKEEFRKLTENNLLLDGATGSNLMASGMPRGICTETWVIEHKDIIQGVGSTLRHILSQVNDKDAEIIKVFITDIITEDEKSRFKSN